MKMYVYLNKRLIVVETNTAFALSYWIRRKQFNENITWKMRQS